MPKNKIDIFKPDEREFLKLCIRYHIEQYVPELLQREGENGKDLRLRINRVGKIRSIVNRLGSAGDTILNSGALLMLDGLQRESGEKAREIFDRINADSIQEDHWNGEEFNNISWEQIFRGENTGYALLDFLNLAAETNVALKPLAYILGRKLEQYLFWTTLDRNGLKITEHVIPEEQFEAVQRKWNEFKRRRVHWIAAEKSEAMDGFAQENIYRCLRAIGENRKIRLGGQCWIPVRVWVQEGGWLYRRSIPYLAARGTDDRAIALLRLDTDDVVLADKRMTSEAEWITRQDIATVLSEQWKEICVEGEYFYSEDDNRDYIQGKLGLNDDVLKEERRYDSFPYRMPYTKNTESVMCGRPFCAADIRMNPVEYRLLIRSCGEFALFREKNGGLSDHGWNSVEEWKQNQQIGIGDQRNSQNKKGKLEDSYGIADKRISFDSVCAVFSCMRLAQQPVNTKRTDDRRWDINIPDVSTDYWWAAADELDWLNYALKQNAELCELFGLQVVQKNIEENLKKFRGAGVFLPSVCCENQKHDGVPFKEPLCNQSFSVMPQNTFVQDAMKTALSCVKQEIPVSYQYRGKDDSVIGSLIFPYRFQITKNKKIQLLAYDLKQFKLLDINSFGNNLYQDIRQCSLDDVSQPVRLYLLSCSTANYQAEFADRAIPPKKLLAAREIEYYYRKFCGGAAEEERSAYSVQELKVKLSEIRKELNRNGYLDKSVFDPIIWNGEKIAICSQMILGDKLWGNKRVTMKNWTVDGWLAQYETLFRSKENIDAMSVVVAAEEKEMKTMVAKFTEQFQRASENLELDVETKQVLEGAFRYYYDYLKTSYTPGTQMWNDEVYHSDRELLHMARVLEQYLNICQRNRGVTVRDLKTYIYNEIHVLTEVKRCSALLAVEGEFTPEKMDLIYHIFSEFKLEPAVIVCDPNDLYSENAFAFQMVRCIRVEYPSYSFRKLHEGILALQDFLTPLAPKDLKEIIKSRIEKTEELYRWKGESYCEQIRNEPV